MDKLIVGVIAAASSGAAVAAMQRTGRGGNNNVAENKSLVRKLAGMLFNPRTPSTLFVLKLVRFAKTFFHWRGNIGPPPPSPGRYLSTNLSR